VIYSAPIIDSFIFLKIVVMNNESSSYPNDKAIEDNSYPDINIIKNFMFFITHALDRISFFITMNR